MTAFHLTQPHTQAGARPAPLWLKLALVGALLCTGAEVRAAPAACEVVAVTDGDSLTVRCGDAADVPVRLAGVDGPGHQALFWARAQRNLSALLLSKSVRVDVVDTDSDGAKVAQVYVGNTHVNAVVVGSGMARCRAATTQNDWCSREESSAKANLRGVWSDPWLSTHAPQKPALRPNEVAA